MDPGTGAFVGLAILLLTAVVCGVLYLARADARGGVFQDIAEHGARDMGSAALALQAILEPGRRYLLEAQRTDEAAERAQNDGEATPGGPPPDDGTEADWSGPPEGPEPDASGRPEHVDDRGGGPPRGGLGDARGPRPARTKETP